MSLHRLIPFLLLSLILPLFDRGCGSSGGGSGGATSVADAPSSLNATAHDGQVDLAWTAPVSNGGATVTDYKIYRGTSSGNLTYLANVGSATTAYQDDTVTNGTPYFYTVCAVNSVGDSAHSNEATATPQPGTSIPGVPQSFFAMGSNTQTDLSWSAPASDGNSAITDYRIYRGTTSGSLSYYDHVGGTATVFQDTGLTNGTTYFYAVSAVNAIGEGSQSSENVATPLHIGELLSVAAGSFNMGSASGDEAPVHTVSLSAYQIGKYEVTNQEYADILNWAHGKGYLENFDGSAYTSGTVYLDGKTLIDVGVNGCEITFGGGQFSITTRDTYSMANHPVTEISWYGAVAYSCWLSESQGLTPCYSLSTWARTSPLPSGYRLPTEAEWERAAAWDNGSSKHWEYAFQSDSIAQNRSNYDDANPLTLTEFAYTTPVGYYNGSNGTVDSQSPVGCYDMSGNIWELVHDYYSSSYYSISPATDPPGPASGTSFVLRGGYWTGAASNCRCSDRNDTFGLGGYGNLYGFRLAKTP